MKLSAIRSYCYFLIAVIVLSCNNDIDDNIEVATEEKVPEVFTETSDALFVDEKGTEHGMGAISSSCYGFSGAIEATDAQISDNVPEAFDLSEFLPPIGNQGSQGSCVSWAVSYYMKSLQERLEKDEPIILSPSYTFNQLALNGCNGSSVSQTLDLLESKGVCTFETFPYSENQCNVQPGAVEDEEAKNAKISSFRALSGKDLAQEMKTLITDQKPVVLVIGLDDTFGVKDGLGLSAYREHTVLEKDIIGSHAVLAVGYSDEFQAFKVVNSWGEDWGDNGFGWVDYAAFENVLNPDYEFRIICEAYVAYDIEP